MECLAVGRHSLRRARVSPVFLSQKSLPSRTNSQNTLAESPRRMAHGRSTHTNGSKDDKADNPQAYPLSGYYALILNSPSPYHGSPITAPVLPNQPQDKPVPASPADAQTPQEKMSIVFGTRLAGPGRQSRYNPGEAPPVSEWQTVNGVPIPPRPEEPENCCMSGCVHCVWDDYRDEMEEWAGRVAKAKAKGGPEKGTQDMRTAPRAEVDSATHSMDDDGGGSEANWPAPSQDDDLFGNIPVGIREFMKVEKKLRVKHQKEAEL